VDEIERKGPALGTDDPATQVVPVHWFDLDHLCAEIGKDRRAVRAGECAGDLQDADAREKCRPRCVALGRLDWHYRPLRF
jgi:hypothetical protein